MPEEINRIVTDRLSDLLFTPDEIADANLKHEGMPPEAIHRVGNIMIDTLEANRERAARLNVGDIVPRNAPPLKNGYAVLTLHRPANVDDPAILTSLVRLMTDELAPALPILWTLHPRTRKQLEAVGLWASLVACPSLVLLEPLGYLEMLRLNLGARVMLTDSGGLQEECCVLGTPCITLRPNTERPVTLREKGGTAELAGSDVGRIRALFATMKDAPRRASCPPLWDGHTAERIVDVFRGLK